MQVISNSGYKLSLRAQRSGVKQSQDMGLLLYETLREHYAVASFAMTNMFLQNWDAPYLISEKPNWLEAGHTKVYFSVYLIIFKYDFYRKHGLLFIR